MLIIHSLPLDDDDGGGKFGLFCDCILPSDETTPLIPVLYIYIIYTINFYSLF